jgi:hypothetical protein
MFLQPGQLMIGLSHSSSERPDMNALRQLSRSEKITGVAGILLLIGLIAFPWYHVGVAGFTVDGQAFSGASYSATALQSDGAFAGVLALIVLIVLLAVLAVSRLTSAQLPDLPITWRAAEMYAAMAVLLLLAIKFLFHIGNFGWGFYADIVLAIVLVYGAIGLGSRNSARSAPAGAHQA